MSRLSKLMRSFLRPSGTGSHGSGGLPDPAPLVPPSARSAQGSADGSAQVGDAARIEYAPELDGEPDPGEVVWAWVPYEDDPAQGKDRPVLVIGREAGSLLALQLTSQDHDLDAAQEARDGRYWMDIGTGGWDHERRPSEVRLDRLLRLEEHAVRREGAILDRSVFDAVLRAAHEHHDF